MLISHRNLPRINPNEIARSLSETINGNISGIEIIERWPPTSVQIIDVIFLTQLLNASPIRIGRSKPFTIAWANVDVNRAEIVVFLMTGRSCVGHFHVELNRIHPENHMTNM